MLRSLDQVKFLELKMMNVDEDDWIAPKNIEAVVKGVVLEKLIINYSNKPPREEKKLVKTDKSR